MYKSGHHFLFILLIVLAVYGVPSYAQAQQTSSESGGKVIHLPQSFQAQSDAESAAARSGNGISYHGGPLILRTTNVYYIWYGNWHNNSATTILSALARHIGGSPYFNINTTYYDGARRRVDNSVHYAGSTNDNYSRGHYLTDAEVKDVVNSAINSGRLPKDTNGLYFVLASADVSQTDFCTKYCGWHNSGTIAGRDIKYSYVGNAVHCPDCVYKGNQSVSPNGNVGADAMASVIAHELEETVTDPDMNAWYRLSLDGKRKKENADLCVWHFGTMQSAPNGSKYNMILGGLRFLIQQNWVNASGGYCALRY